jgi:hypothetical protein
MTFISIDAYHAHRDIDKGIEAASIRTGAATAGILASAVTINRPEASLVRARHG